MPRILSGDIGESGGSGKIWIVAGAILAACGLGYGVYEIVQPVPEPKPAYFKVDSKTEAQIKEESDKRREQQREDEKKFRASLGLNESQLAALDYLDNAVTTTKNRTDDLKAILGPDKYEKWQQEHNRGWRGGRGGFGGPGGFGGGPPGGFGGGGFGGPGGNFNGGGPPGGGQPGNNQNPGGGNGGGRRRGGGGRGGNNQPDSTSNTASQ